MLAIIRLLTTLLGIISTMLLSKSLSLQVYGTYSQANLIISVGTSFSILGLTDGTNFFFNKTSNNNKQKEYISTIFALQIFIGIFVGLGILTFRNNIVDYFQNDFLASLFVYIAFRPLLNNLLAMLQNLQISIGKAKTIAGRNIVVAIVKLMAIYLTVSIFDNDVRAIFMGLLLLDLATVIYFWVSFGKWKFQIKISDSKLSLIPDILKFCIPMGIFVLTNSLSRDIDKVCIGRLGGTEQLAIYTNCSTILPVDIISAAFLTVVIPIMTRYIASANFENGSNLFSCYIQIGYLTTTTFSVAIITLADEVILFLYGDQYLIGKPVFVMYMIVSILRFANLSLVLSANGETQRLMRISIFGLIANILMNIFFYYVMGFIGPAIATVIITIVTTFCLLKRSITILQTSWNGILNFKRLTVYLLEIAAISFIFRQIANCLELSSAPLLVVIVLIGGGICGVTFLLNWKILVSLLKDINRLR